MSPKTFHDTDKFLKKEEIKKIFGSGKVILRHNYSKKRHKRDKKKSKGYYYEYYQRSRILREWLF